MRDGSVACVCLKVQMLLAAKQSSRHSQSVGKRLCVCVCVCVCVCACVIC